MASQYSLFDTSKLILLPLSERVHDLDISVIKPLEPVDEIRPAFCSLASTILEAKASGAAVILMMGAHVLRAGVQRYLIDLMEKGFISCIATNGASVIHDFEFALVGQTTESVARYIRLGQFGLWKETGIINHIISQAARDKKGFGEAVGKTIAEGKYINKDMSIFAAGYRFGVPVTVHVGIGYDIIHQHPNFDGAAAGKTSYTDFLIFTKILQNLEGGVVMNFGSAVMAPEVFLKALAMVRNVAQQNDSEIKRFTTLVCDLHRLQQNFHSEPDKSQVDYFFRPWKTMLVRTVADGGQSVYINASHDQTVPELWTAIQNQKENQ